MELGKLQGEGIAILKLRHLGHKVGEWWAPSCHSLHKAEPCFLTPDPMFFLKDNPLYDQSPKEPREQTTCLWSPRKWRPVICLWTLEELFLVQSAACTCLWAPHIFAAPVYTKWVISKVGQHLATGASSCPGRWRQPVIGLGSVSSFSKPSLLMSSPSLSSI